LKTLFAIFIGFQAETPAWQKNADWPKLLASTLPRHGVVKVKNVPEGSLNVSMPIRNILIVTTNFNQNV